MHSSAALKPAECWCGGGFLINLPQIRPVAIPTVDRTMPTYSHITDCSSILVCFVFSIMSDNTLSLSENGSIGRAHFLAKEGVSISINHVIN
jgi:hypothetical protein